MPDAGEEVLAFPDSQARQLAGVSLRRLGHLAVAADEAISW